MPSCSGDVCKLQAAKAETCTISMVLGDGTAHAAQVTTIAATPNDGCGSCAAGVDQVMLDGKPAGTLLTLASATCGAALDAGGDASGDASGDAKGE